MNPFWFSMGCFVGIALGMFAALMGLALCRAAAQADEQSDEFMPLINGVEK